MSGRPPTLELDRNGPEFLNSPIVGHRSLEYTATYLSSLVSSDRLVVGVSFGMTPLGPRPESLGKISIKSARGLPGADFELRNVNVLLGANGAGKSEALALLTKMAPGGYQLVRVEGGRTIQVTGSLQVDQSTINQFGTLENAQQQHFAHLQSTLSGRIQAALFVLFQRDEVANRRYLRTLKEWIKAGRPGDLPVLPESTLDALFQKFNEVFPSITVHRVDANGQLLCTRFEHQYSAAGLSDGEKQVFALLADMSLAEAKSFVLVDEPELNLNSLLACQLWSEIEKMLPSAVFVYATHSLSFAMRPEVETVVVLGGERSDSVVIDDASDLARADLRPFLGAVPAILSSKSAVLVEGDDTSTDAPFYKWLLSGDDDLPSVVPLGGCDAVAAAVRGESLWRRLTSGVALAGVIDRDYRADETLGAMQPCVVLELNECESCLCAPDIVCAVADALGLAEKVPQRSAVEQLIAESYQADILSIVARRVAARCKRRLAVSVPKNQLESLTTEQSLQERLRERAAEQVAEANAIGPSAVDLVFAEELERCNAALRAGYSAQLRLMPGKATLAAVSALVGVKSGQFMRVAFRHLDPKAFPETRVLRAALRSALQLPDETPPESPRGDPDPG